MNLALVRRAIEAPSRESVGALLDDDATVFWIDWHEVDENIIDCCELLLRTAMLRAEIVNADTPEYDLFIHYKEKRA